MAEMKIPPIRVRDAVARWRHLDAIPDHVWDDVIKRAGDLILGTTRTTCRGGTVFISAKTNQRTVDVVRAILREHGIVSAEGERAPWEQDPDAWKNA